ncbi:MAG: hypothetical protein ACI9FN_002170 [Saprospiraceae bacterium]|jgi:hypothetical protein
MTNYNQMKKLLIFSLMLFALHASAQRNFPLNGTSSITSIHSGNEASEGDLYYDTTTGDLYIGLNDGTLYLMAQDSQSISLAGNILSLTRGSSVDLTPYVNADDQTLIYTNIDTNDNINTLRIEGSAVFNIDDNHLGTNNQILSGARTVAMSGSSLTFVGTQDVIIEADGDVGIGTSTPTARLDVANGTVRFSNYGDGNVLDTLSGTHPHSAFHLGVDVDGNVLEVNTIKSAKIFYPPSIVIDVSTTGVMAPLDLYAEYVARFGMPLLKSPSSPAAIPTYSRDELYYYVTDLDGTVFANLALTDGGVFSYEVMEVPAGNCTWINVVFVVK